MLLVRHRYSPRVRYKMMCKCCRRFAKEAFRLITVAHKCSLMHIVGRTVAYLEPRPAPQKRAPEASQSWCLAAVDPLPLGYGRDRETDDRQSGERALRGRRCDAGGLPVEIDSTVAHNRGYRCAKLTQ